MSAEPADLVELLRLRATERPHDTAYIFDDGETEERPVDYAWVDRRARAVAAAITDAGIGAGERVLLMFAPGADYVIGFFACLYAGVVAVPVYPPQGARGLERIGAVFFDCTPSAILSTSDIVAVAGERVAGMGLRWIATDTIDDDAAGGWSESAYAPGGLAFLQYTSGSTASPKGVMVTHANLLHNTAVIGQACELGPDTIGVSWLPPYHDMGLIGGILSPLRGGFPCVLMPPAAFLYRPRRWLEAISRHGATISAAPDFAYAECVRRIPPDERSGLDLSRWAHALVGAETVRPATLRAFTAAFAECGLPASSLYPCYGLAEATLFVTGGTAGEPACVLHVDRDRMAQGAIVTVPDGTGMALTGCGHPHGPDKIRVVDPDLSTVSDDDAVGEIWVSGPTVAAGYWNAPETSEPVFRARLTGDDRAYLRTGDLGFRHAGDLYVTGRVKDLMVVRGRNHHPQDIELAAEGAHPLLRPHRGAAFAIEAGSDGDVGVVLVHEVTREFRTPDATAVQAAVRAAVVAEHGLRLLDVLLVRGGAIPRTSSGKIRRAACREAYLERSLAIAGGDEPVPPPPVVPVEVPVSDRIAAVVARVLRVTPADLDERATLVALGLDSLTAFELRAALGTEIGVDVGLEELLGSQTVGELLRTALDPAPEAGGEPVAEPADADIASFGQQRMWLLSRAQPDSSAYHVGAGTHIAGSFNAEAFADCIRQVQLRHAALRTTIVLDDDGVLRQRIRSESTIDVRFVDRLDEPLERFATGFVRRPFDLANEPPIRVAVVSLSDTDHHVLVAAHHLVLDAASLEIIFAEVAAMYRARCAGTAIPDLGAAPQYSRWAHTQRTALTPERLEPDLVYWKAKLHGITALRLPGPTPNGALGPAHAQVLLPASVSARLRDFARITGATPFMVLTAAFAAVLSHWTGQPDVIIATPLAGRDRSSSAGVVGFLANTVGLRLRVEPNGSFADLAAGARQTCLDAYAHGAVPFEKVVEAVQPDRADGRQPLAQAMLALRRLPSAVELGPGVTASAYEIAAPDAQFDVALHLNEHDDGGIDGFAIARPDALGADDVVRLVEAYVTLLTSALSSPAEPVARLPIQAGASRTRIITDLARGPIAEQSDACLHELFERQVDATPDAVAVCFEEVEVTYAELDVRANQLAHQLIASGVGPERLVGICLPRSVEMVVALLGVLKAGGCYVPLDPEYPRSRLAFMIADAGASIVLTNAAISASGLFDDVDTRLFEVAAAATGAPSGRPGVGVSPDNLAYVIYTSGSTGLPKGAMNAHRGVVNRIEWGQRFFGLEPGEAVLQKTPLSFDVSGWELYWPLTTGGRLVLARPGGHRDPAYLAELIRSRDISTVQFVPSMLSAFLAADAGPGCANVLRRIICSGEALSPALVTACHDQLPGVALFNLYGPTEAAIEVTALECAPDLTRMTIGRPIDNARTHVLDVNGEPTPIGVPGELHLGGVPVARGYWRRPALTAQRFVPDPFGYGARLYRTGDQARVCPDGAVDYLGRLDGQVKIRGVRIELGEIETALAGHPAVSAVAVDMRPGPGGIGRLVGYLVCAGPAPSVTELRHYLADRLPAAMTPAAYVTVANLPVGPSGKLDRAALPDPESGHSDGYVAPRNPTEEVTAEIWAQVLGVERVGVLDDFFELGGHSLLATQVLVRVRAAFGIEPPLAELLSGRSTVERLAEAIVLQQLSSTDADEMLALIAALDDNDGWLPHD